MTMPSYGATPPKAFFVYYQDETDEFAVHWRGDEWGTDHHADMRGWYHDSLSESGYDFLLNHYGLPKDDPNFDFEKVRKLSPQSLVAARRNLEKEQKLDRLSFREGIDY